MKKSPYLVVMYLFMFISIISCNKNDNDTPEETPTAVVLDNPINDFVWRGMNSYYNWQSNVTALADTKDDNVDEYYTYLNTFSSPETLFESLLYDSGNIDRFSWFIDDYTVQDASFRGVNDAYGFEFDLARMCSNCDEVIGFIKYVVPNSPASEAGLKRGDMFYKFQGITLTMDTYLIVNDYYDSNVTSISMAFNTIENSTIKPNGIEATLGIREVIENPVHYSSTITTSGGKKVGYLVYNGFKYTFHQELNEVFTNFKNEGIQELVLDLRYNGGGSVLTSAYLASMIYGAASTNDDFARLTFNSKHPEENGAYTFFNKGNVYDKDGNDTNTDILLARLNTLSRVFIITSGDTASASEMIINGLSPYITVVKIGTTTYGKNVGSITLYDSPNFDEKNINPDHTNAMQPIVFQIYNKLDQSDYINGFDPDYEVIEYISEIKPFGDMNEPLLKTALDLIDGLSAKPSNKQISMENTQLLSSLDKKKFSKEMYILPQE